jgi:hypothetical protein
VVAAALSLVQPALAGPLPPVQQTNTPLTPFTAAQTHERLGVCVCEHNQVTLPA